MQYYTSRVKMRLGYALGTAVKDLSSEIMD
jgi:hypothetical protein